MEKEWDNEERRRYYGLRKGDIVEVDNFGHNIPKLKGEVVEYGCMDNNAVYIKTEKEKPIEVVAEWCKIIIKVEDRK